MDLAVYISELLLEHGTINVPGLGVFKRVSKKAFFDEQSKTFYPPHYQAQFEAKAAGTDDLLIQHISKKNRVSLGSATYFLEKYLNSLLQQAKIGEAPLGQLGWVYRDGSKLQFKANATASADHSAIFGFAPIKLFKQALPMPETVATPVADEVEQTEVLITEAPDEPELTDTTSPVEETTHTAPVSVFITPEQPSTPAATEPVPQVYAPPVYSSVEEEVMSPDPLVLNTSRNDSGEDEELVREPMSVWIVGLIAAAVIILAIFAFYKYNQMTGDGVRNTQKSSASQQLANSTPDTVVIKPAGEAGTTEATIADSTMLNVGSLNYNRQIHKWALIGGHYENIHLADKAIENLKSQGIPATILESSPGASIKIALGYFETFKEGQDAKMQLVKKKNLNRADLFVLQLKK